MLSDGSWRLEASVSLGTRTITSGIPWRMDREFIRQSQSDDGNIESSARGDGGRAPPARRNKGGDRWGRGGRREVISSEKSLKDAIETARKQREDVHQVPNALLETRAGLSWRQAAANGGPTCGIVFSTWPEKESPWRLTAVVFLGPKPQPKPRSKQTDL